MTESAARDEAERGVLDTFAVVELPALLKDFAAEAEARHLPLQSLEIATPAEPRFDLDRVDAAFFWAAGWLAFFAEPNRRKARVHQEVAWLFCRLQDDSDSEAPEQWYVTPGGELRRSAGSSVAPWPAEFYSRLSSAIQGGASDDLLPPSAARTLVTNLAKEALAGEPRTVSRHG